MKKSAFLSIAAVVLVFCGIAQAWTTPQLVTSGVNTSSNEIEPFLSFDGKTLYFSRDDGGNYNIYQATRQGTSGPFTSVTEALDHATAGADHVMREWVSPDNLRMYYHAEGSSWTIDMSTRASVTDPWTEGTVLSELSSMGPLGATLSQDELTIVFNAYNGQNDSDIYMATRPNTSSPFGNITNLSTINSSASDGGEFLTPDGLTLYFNSNRNGSEQLFEATRQSLSDPFGNIQHLSFFDSYVPLNPCLSADGTTLFFDSGTPGNGADIYYSEIPEPATLLLLGLGGWMLRKRIQN